MAAPTSPREHAPLESTPRPAWVVSAVTRLGEPAYEYPAPDLIRFGDRARQCWAWALPGHTYTAIIDDMGGWFRVILSGASGRRAELSLDREPTDGEMLALSALAWPVEG